MYEHRGREGRKECTLCDDECESFSHVLWECPVYNSLRNDFIVGQRSFLGMDLKVSRAWIVLKEYILFWEVSCGRMTFALCLIVKDYIVDVCELRKAIQAL